MLNTDPIPPPKKIPKICILSSLSCNKKNMPNFVKKLQIISYFSIDKNHIFYYY